MAEKNRGEDVCRCGHERWAHNPSTVLAGGYLHTGACDHVGCGCPLFKKESIREAVVALAQRPQRITLDEYRALRLNSYEAEHIVPNMSDEAVVHAVETFLLQCNVEPRRPYATYNNAMLGLWTPELVSRFTALRGREATMIDPKVAQAMVDGPVSMLLEVQQECIALRKAMERACLDIEGSAAIALAPLFLGQVVAALRAAVDARAGEPPPFAEGDRVIKSGGDYTFEGHVIMCGKKRNGKTWRVAVEDDRGVVHIFAPSQLQPVLR